MTNQELFDRVAQHLLTQNEPANDGLNTCAYRGTRGTKCAIGCLIPDERYHPDFEGNRVTYPDVREAAGIAVDQLPLAEALQDAHDQNASQLFFWRQGLPKRLHRIAEKFDLNKGALPCSD